MLLGGGVLAQDAYGPRIYHHHGNKDNYTEGKCTEENSIDLENSSPEGDIKNK